MYSYCCTVLIRAWHANCIGLLHMYNFDAFQEEIQICRITVGPLKLQSAKTLENVRRKC